MMTVTTGKSSETASQVSVRNVSKRYGDVTALDRVSLDMDPGNIIGLLGPNGAGKTTLLEILCGLRGPDSGTVEVLGLDPARERRKLALRLGVLTQEFGLPSAVRTHEALELFAQLYPRSLDVDVLLAEFDLTSKRRARFRDLSGGQRRRLALAKALVGDPDVLILDEPTTALDPQGRDFLRERIRSLARSGRTILLSTHDIVDAQLLCDRVTIIDRGVVLASGSTDELIRRHAGKQVVRLRPDVTPLPNAIVERDRDGNQIVYTDDARALLAHLGEADDGHPVEIRATTLEDVFLLLTGRELRS
jgi:ABC-2 type transport system ATP-binding protein